MKYYFMLMILITFIKSIYYKSIYTKNVFCAIIIVEFFIQFYYVLLKFLWKWYFPCGNKMPSCNEKAVRTSPLKNSNLAYYKNTCHVAYTT